ncbi:ferredoxin--NADP reductase [Ostreibacterium oceani]|uniref:ferredoxin--NADP(+) reductase n=1 Tax=Ostreibacterium oceani TaxID=2654998 RepID=A0A6N7EZC1_9GAMM|nr:ferredoxin--NADP reductase [Ostreibacterium oceani]MPV86517.1 ferredoxin--NADP reductase [Ostreibacterium oceani]
MGYLTEKVTAVHHWNETLFSFKTTRQPTFRFKNGHFIMIGLEVEGKPLMRAYSIASANYEDELEFLSIKVPDGPLTSRLQKIQVGDELLMSDKSTGTLVTDYILPGKNLWLISTGTGLAPFMSIIKDPEIYEQFDKVILTHGVRYVSELAYNKYITEALPNNEFFGEWVKDKLLYYPTVTREPYQHQGRITDLIKYGKINLDLGLPPMNPEVDRFMVCGSPSMLKDTCAILNAMGFREGTKKEQGHYAIERAFVEQ